LKALVEDGGFDRAERLLEQYRRPLQVADPTAEDLLALIALKRTLA
jgi:hypothetical protein